MRRIRTALVGALTATALAFSAAPAQAVALDYCYSSLRGGGSLAPDNDIRRAWEWIEAHYGQLSHTEHIYWLSDPAVGPGPYTQVWEAVRFVFVRGGSVGYSFTCVDPSGPSYYDENERRLY